jgi:hypothetical protein
MGDCSGQARAKVRDEGELVGQPGALQARNCQLDHPHTAFTFRLLRRYIEPSAWYDPHLRLSNFRSPSPSPVTDFSDIYIRAAGLGQACSIF